MRDYLNGILIFIGSTSLTDEEFESIDLENTDDQVAVYEALLEVLESRGSGDVAVFRLQCYFMAEGVNVVSVNQIPNSNIFFGAPLE